jgi:starvation-inducible outer membrane lipoprotein
MRRYPITITPALFTVVITACVPYQIFPPGAREGVDPHFDISRWRMFPNQAEGHKIELGGRIVQSNIHEDAVVIVVTQLPIAEHPAYGPKDTGQRGRQFTILYQGKIEPLFLQAGNRVTVVGHTRSPTLAKVDDIVRSFPTVAAQCIHFWNTGGKDISDFSASGAGHEYLREETYCATS